MLHTTIISCDVCNCNIEGEKEIDYKSDRVKMDFDNTLRSVFVRSAKGVTLHQYDYCIKCSDDFLEEMDKHAKKFGNPTSEDLAKEKEDVKAEQRRKAEERTADRIKETEV